MDGVCGNMVNEKEFYSISLEIKPEYNNEEKEIDFEKLALEAKIPLVYIERSLNSIFFPEISENKIKVYHESKDSKIYCLEIYKNSTIKTTFTERKDSENDLENNYYSYRYFEAKISCFISRMVYFIYKKFEINAPLSIKLILKNINGLKIPYKKTFEIDFFKYEFQIEEYSDFSNFDMVNSLKPLFDSIFKEIGYEGSDSYDNKGIWFSQDPCYF